MINTHLFDNQLNTRPSPADTFDKAQLLSSLKETSEGSIQASAFEFYKSNDNSYYI